MVHFPWFCPRVTVSISEPPNIALLDVEGRPLRHLFGFQKIPKELDIGREKELT